MTEKQPFPSTILVYNLPLNSSVSSRTLQAVCQKAASNKVNQVERPTSASCNQQRFDPFTHNTLLFNITLVAQCPVVDGFSIYLMQFVQHSSGTSVNPAECQSASATSPSGQGHGLKVTVSCTTLPRYEGISTCCAGQQTAGSLLANRLSQTRYRLNTNCPSFLW